MKIVNMSLILIFFFKEEPLGLCAVLGTIHKVQCLFKKETQMTNIVEPTCAYCTRGSYASLSVCPSVCHWIIIHISLDNNSYLRKYYRYKSETSPQHKSVIGVHRKNPNYIPSQQVNQWKNLYKICTRYTDYTLRYICHGKGS